MNWYQLDVCHDLIEPIQLFLEPHDQWGVITKDHDLLFFHTTRAVDDKRFPLALFPLADKKQHQHFIYWQFLIPDPTHRRADIESAQAGNAARVFMEIADARLAGPLVASSKTVEVIAVLLCSASDGIGHFGLGG